MPGPARTFASSDTSIIRSSGSTVKELSDATFCALRSTCSPMASFSRVATSEREVLLSVEH